MAMPDYCDFNSTAASAVAGKDILLSIWNAAGTTLLAIAGQRGLTINRSAESIEVSSKDTEGGWKSNIAGMKEWSIDTDGLYVANDASHKALSEAFENGDPVCVVVSNNKTNQNMFGGIASVTDYSVEAPYDDAMTYSITLSGMGKLTDLTEEDAPMMVDPDVIIVTKGGEAVSAVVRGADAAITTDFTQAGVTLTISGNRITVSASNSAAVGIYDATLTAGTESCKLAIRVVAA